MTLSKYIVGKMIRLIAVFTDPIGAPVVFDTVFATMILPDGTIADGSGLLTSATPGTYVVLFVPALAGLYQYRIAGKTALASDAIEATFYAQTSFSLEAGMPSGFLGGFTAAGTIQLESGMDILLESGGKLQTEG